MIDDRLNALDIGIGLFDVGPGNGPLFLGVAIDRLFIGRFGLIDCAFAFVQRIGHLVEAGLRRVALLGQCVSAVKGLLRQHQCRLRALHLRFPRGNDFHPRSDEYVGKLGLRNSLGRPHLLVLGQSFGIVDPYEDCSRRDILATFDWYFLHPSIDTRGYIQPRCIDLALYEQWFRPQEIEDRKRDDGSCNDTDDNGRVYASLCACSLLSITWCVGRTLNFLARGRRVHACLHLVHDRLGRQASPDFHAPCLTWRHRDLASAGISPLVWTRSDLQLRALNSTDQRNDIGRAATDRSAVAKPFLSRP